MELSACVHFTRFGLDRNRLCAYVYLCTVKNDYVRYSFHKQRKEEGEDDSLNDICLVAIATTVICVIIHTNYMYDRVSMNLFIRLLCVFALFATRLDEIQFFLSAE